MDEKNNVDRVVYRPEHIQKMLGRGRRQTYELLREGRFPVKKVGKEYLIPKEPFDNWLNSPGFYNIKFFGL